MLGEYGSDPDLLLFRAHISPIDRAAWLSYEVKMAVAKPVSDNSNQKALCFWK